MSQNLLEKIKGVLFGVAVGDALGVPVEFKSRSSISSNPITDMIGYGTYNLPPGTWSDDSSLTFCLAEALTEGFDIKQIANNFVRWVNENYWTPRGEVFDVGITTMQAIRRVSTGEEPTQAGGRDENSNGNGSLMRIAPLLFYLLNKNADERFAVIKDVSSLTHGHIRSVFACFYYLEFARKLFREEDKFDIYRDLKTEIPQHAAKFKVPENELKHFKRLLENDINLLPEDEISGSGYVIDTLEAAVWCLLTTDDFSSAVLKAVNLGQDTDTTGAVTGGLAGLLYGFNAIPATWIEKLARKDDILDLANRLRTKLESA